MLRWSILIYCSAGSKSVLIFLCLKAANLPFDITSFLFRVECCNLRHSVRMKTLIPEAWIKSVNTDLSLSTLYISMPVSTHSSKAAKSKLNALVYKTWDCALPCKTSECLLYNSTAFPQRTVICTFRAKMLMPNEYSIHNNFQTQLRLRVTIYFMIMTNKWGHKV